MSQEPKTREREYFASSGHVMASVQITERIPPEKESYLVNFRFLTRDKSREVKIKYGAFVPDKIFERVKKSESGIEEILASEHDQDWKGQRHVMRCIMDFEDQFNGVGRLKPLFKGLYVERV